MFESPFQWWAQCVMPVTFDNSLSYYEVLAKLTKYIEGLTGDVKHIEDIISTIEGIEDVSQFVDFLESIKNQIGNLANLNTTNKNDLVSAINEVAQKANQAYVKPSTGIPEDALSREVREKLNSGSGIVSSYIINNVRLKTAPNNNSPSELGLGTYSVPEGGIPWDTLSEDVQRRINTGGSGGTDDYTDLINKPQINGHTLNAGDNSIRSLGLGTYSKPADGIPESDLNPDVRSKLNTSGGIADENNGFIASRDYEIGELVYINGVLYKVTIKTLTGSEFVVGNNIEETDINDELKDINEKIDKMASGEGLDSWSLSVKLAGQGVNVEQRFFEYINCIGGEDYLFIVTPNEYAAQAIIRIYKKDGTLVKSETKPADYNDYRFTFTPDDAGEYYCALLMQSSGDPDRYYIKVTLEYTQSQGITELWNAINNVSDVSEDVAALELLTQAHETDIANLGDSIADEYSSSATYNIGDYVMHSDRLYICKTNIEEAEAWNSDKWSEKALSDDVKRVDKDISDIINNSSITVLTIPEVSGVLRETVNVDIPAGEYIFSIGSIVSTDVQTTNNRIMFYHNDETLWDITISRTGSYKSTKEFLKSITSITFYASDNYSHSNRDSFTFSNVVFDKLMSIRKQVNINTKQIYDIEKVTETNDFATEYGVTVGRLTTGGEVNTADPQYVTTDFIPVTAGVEYVVKRRYISESAFTLYICTYDGNKDFVEYMGINNAVSPYKYFNKPGTSFVRFSYSNIIYNEGIIIGYAKNQIDKIYDIIKPEVTKHSYTGNRLSLEMQNEFLCTKFRDADTTIPAGKTAQGFAIYKDFLFQMLADDECRIYNMANNWEIVGDFTTPSGHGNSAVFSNVFYDVTDEFPLLYSSDINGYVYIIRISRNSATLIKTLFFPDTSFGYDAQLALDINGECYTVGAQAFVSSRYSTAVINKCDLTDLTDNGDDTYTPAILDTFTVTFTEPNVILQGVKMLNGNLYLPSGGNSTSVLSLIHVINTTSKTLINTFTDFPEIVKIHELEDIDFIPSVDDAKYDMIAHVRNYGYYRFIF